MNNTALRAGAQSANNTHMVFANEKHEKFYFEKLEQARYQDCYHKALIYILGISEDTRNHFSQIYDIKSGYKFFLFARTDGDTLRLNLGSEPDELDPVLISSVDGACLAVNSFAGLYIFDDSGSVIPDLAAPCAYFNELLASPAYFPVKQSEVESKPDWQTNPGAWAQEADFITNGAYTLSAWAHDESMTYVKNPNYHRADEVEVETL